MIKIIFSIVLNCLILYGISKINFAGIEINSNTTLIIYGIVRLIGDFLLDHILNPIIKIVNLPLKYLTLGFSSLIISTIYTIAIISITNIFSPNEGILITNDFISYLKLAILISPIQYIKNLIV